MPSQPEAVQELGFAQDEVQSPIDGAESSRNPASGSLNIQASPRFADPDLTSFKMSEKIESLYPILRIPKEYDASSPFRNGHSSNVHISAVSPPSDDDEPFLTPLTFHIPKQKLQNALDAPPTSIAAYWQYTRKELF